MPFTRGKFFCILIVFIFCLAAFTAQAQSGNAGAIRGTVSDPTGAVIPGATVHLTNLNSGVDRTVTSDAQGQFEFPNVTFNNYMIAGSASGFAPLRKPVVPFDFFPQRRFNEESTV